MGILYYLVGSLIYLYFLSYIVLGFIQPIGAICRLLGEQRLDSNYAIGLKKYLFAVSTYFAILFLMSKFEPFYDILYIFQIYLLLIPWAFIIWYIRHVRIWRKKRQNISAYDQLQLLNTPHQDRLLLDSYPKKKVCFKQLNRMEDDDFSPNKTAKIRVLPNLKMRANS